MVSIQEQFLIKSGLQQHVYCRLFCEFKLYKCKCVSARSIRTLCKKNKQHYLGLHLFQQLEGTYHPTQWGEICFGNQIQFHTVSRNHFRSLQENTHKQVNVFLNSHVECFILLHFLGFYLKFLVLFQNRDSSQFTSFQLQMQLNWYLNR